MAGSDATTHREHGARTRLAVALGGGGARGLAHIGVLHVLEEQGIRVDLLAGSSMGALVGALSASGLAASEIREIARTFRLPRCFVPGRVAHFESLFPGAVEKLPDDFASLATPLVVTAVDVESGREHLLHQGPLLAAIRASCAVPGVLPPVRHGDRWLVDGSLANVVPVDAAWLAEPDVVIAVHVGRTAAGELPALRSPIASMALRLARVLPNPIAGKVLFDVLVRASEIALSRQTALAAAMATPELLIEPQLTGIGLRDFDRLDEAYAAGRDAAVQALPKLAALLETPRAHPSAPRSTLRLRVDPVCRMAISPARARGSCVVGDRTYYFCSAACLEAFRRDPERYRPAPPPPAQPPGTGVARL